MTVQDNYLQKMGQEIEAIYDDLFKKQEEKVRKNRGVMHGSGIPLSHVMNDDNPLIVQLSYWDPRLGPVPVVLVGNDAGLKLIDEKSMRDAASWMDNIGENEPCEVVKNGLSRLFIKFHVNFNETRGKQALFSITFHYPNKVQASKMEFLEFLTSLSKEFLEQEALASCIANKDLDLLSLEDLETWNNFLIELRKSSWKIIINETNGKVDSLKSKREELSLTSGLLPKVRKLMKKITKGLMINSKENNNPDFSRFKNSKSNEEKLLNLWDAVRENEKRISKENERNDHADDFISVKEDAIEDESRATLNINDGGAIENHLEAPQSRGAALSMKTPSEINEGKRININVEKMEATSNASILAPRTMKQDGFLNVMEQKGENIIKGVKNKKRLGEVAIYLKQEGYNIKLNNIGASAMKLFKLGDKISGYLAMILTINSHDDDSKWLSVNDNMVYSDDKPARIDVFRPRATEIIKSLAPEIKSLVIKGMMVGKFYNDEPVKPIIIPVVITPAHLRARDGEGEFHWVRPLRNELTGQTRYGFFLVHDGGLPRLMEFLKKSLGILGEKILTSERLQLERIVNKTSKIEQFTRLIGIISIFYSMVIMLACLKITPVDFTISIFQNSVISSIIIGALTIITVYIQHRLKKEISLLVTEKIESIDPSTPFAFKLEMNEVIDSSKIMNPVEFSQFKNAFCHDLDLNILEPGNDFTYDENIAPDPEAVSTIKNELHQIRNMLG
ncbi:MAG: hypothetical protein ACTSYS_10305, partial [Promethearchaeota archaeon]